MIKTILENVSLEILKGQTTAFIGPSGSEKSSIINLLADYILPRKAK